VLEAAPGRRSVCAPDGFGPAHLLTELGRTKRTVTPKLIGYFAKRTTKRPDWLKAARVEEVCSVSTCVSEGPDGWIDQWRHNEMWVYDTPELALSVVPDAARGEFDLYAYQMFPVQFTDGPQEAFEIPQLHVEPLPSSFERLGFDIVSRSYGNTFECSPLSCNHMAEQVAVSRYCLVDDADSAFRLAAEFEAGGCEPGPYFVVEVWRQNHDPAAAKQ
jgi:hypothetical protein